MTKKQKRIQWAVEKWQLSTILYFARKKDWMLLLKEKGAGPYTARWFNGFGWGFIGYGL